MEEKFERLKHETEHQGVVLSLEPATFKVKDFISRVRAVVKGQLLNRIIEDLKSHQQGILDHHHHAALLQDEGIPCEILCPGKPDWQKGKVRIAVYLEFCPDAPEVSDDSLDGIRQAITPEV
ncbi:MAG: hypothetical protein KME07_12270 [Pegethrix bostrychoides GSE-TBD4-15B]|jgi:hypothetical protein|uniref:KGK domain-containing protein n=1 Tax=Pegethrix bostrychoides GSE-TBD4-15B TaxID=2839662 RepID=A0A951PAS2_9CYAN|nr:hypothetical protein [Pegethrix bostrychoides GSE-TBD4-15B]